MRKRFWWGNLKERDHMEGLGIVGVFMIKIDLKGTGLDGMELIHLERSHGLSSAEL
jgi:hypothetical protein